MYKHREADLLFARTALLEKLVTASQVQKAMGMLRRIAEAGGSPPPLAEVLIDEKLITEEQREQLAGRLAEANAAITEEQSGLHEVPRRVGRYELLERIGRGGMGAVYRARQLNMDRVVALKVLAPHLTRDSKYIKQFIREARAAGQINHANIVAVHEVGEADGHFFICMEFVEGRTLSRELLARNKIPPLEALDYAAQVADALSAVEKAGIVHRDIKPDNLIKTPKGRIKVTDLGLAKRLSDVTSAGQTGWACGTPYYMSPEQARDSRKVDTRSDIYSLGATLYHLVTGKLAFEGDSSVEVLMRAATDRLVPPAILCPAVPQPLSDLIERMMAREPQDRPQTAAALAAELAECRREIEQLAAGKGGTRRLGSGAKSARPNPAGGADEGTGSTGLILTTAWALAALAVAGLIIELVVPPRKPLTPSPDNVSTPVPHVTTTPAPIPDTPPEDTARDVAMRALYERLRAAADSPEAAGWRALLDQSAAAVEAPGRWRPVLEKARADLSARVERLALGELERRRWLASEEAAWLRPAAAAAEMDEVARLWPGTTAAASAARERANLAEKSAKAIAALEPLFAEWLAAERFDRAEELLGAITSGQSTDLDDWRARASARLADSRKTSEARQAGLRQERAALAEKLKGINRLLSSWDFAPARDQAQATGAVLPRQSRARRRLELIEARAAALLAFRKRLCDRLTAAAENKPIEDARFADRPLGLVVLSADEKGLTLAVPGSAGNATRARAWSALSATERWKLAVAMAYARSEEDNVALALLALGAGRVDDAGRHLDDAEKLGAVPAAHREELSITVLGDGEEDAEALERSARRKLTEGRPAEALSELARTLVSLGRTTWVSERSLVLDRLVESAERDCQAAGLFSARSRDLPPARKMLDYEFDNPARPAALDWSQAEAAGNRPARIEWLREFTGAFSCRFTLSGESTGAELVLAPRPAGAAGTIRLGRTGLIGVGGATMDAEQSPLADGLELALVDGALLWRSPSGSGKARLPADMLDTLASGRLTGWRLALEMPSGGSVRAAHIECRVSDEHLAALRQSRQLAAEAQQRAAGRVSDPLLRAADLRRLALEYRDLPAVSAMAELNRARLLLDAGQSAAARQAVEELLVGYPSQSALFPDARRLLDRIIGRPR